MMEKGRTGALRFASYHGGWGYSLVLQEEWKNYSGEQLWVDVPVVDMGESESPPLLMREKK